MILAGASKIGKSFFCLELCRSLALGDSPFECPLLSVPEPARVLYLEAEVKQQGLQTRGRKIFQDVNLEYLNENLFVLTDLPELTFDQPRGFQLLRQALDEVQPNVVVIDPLGRFIGGLDENSNSEMAKVLGKLDVILKEHASSELALILAHHSKKPDTSANSTFNPLSPHAMRGSSRLFANPDSIIMADRVENYVNSQHGRAWKVKAHFETRQSEGLDDQLFTVNDRNDLRVRWVPPKGPMPKVNPPAPPTEQLAFKGA